MTVNNDFKRPSTLSDVKDIFRDLIYEHKINLNPDTDFSEYICYATHERTFSDEEAVLLNSIMDDCRCICENAEVDIYDLCLSFLYPQN